MNPTTHPTPPSADPIALRVLRALCLLVLCSIISFLLILAVVGSVNPLVHDSNEHFTTAMKATVLVALVLPLVLLWVAYRLRFRSWWVLAGGALVVTPILVWLAADDPLIRRPMSIEEVAPSFPGAEKSHALLMRYASNTASNKDLKLPKIVPPKAADELPSWLAANRAAIDSAWQELAPLRSWYDELNAGERIGDVTEPSLSSPIPAYRPHQILAQVARCRACLQALDGKGDEAIATLVPLLEVGRKIQVNSRTLVRTMIGSAIRDRALDGVEFTLARATVSPESRRQLRRALGPAGGEAGVRRIIALEYPIWTNGAMTNIARDAEQTPPVLRLLGRLIGPLLINPNHTINLVGDYVAAMQEAAARRQTLPQPASAIDVGSPGMKNFFGSTLVVMATPVFQKIVDSYWKQEDRLAALRTKLESPN